MDDKTIKPYLGTPKGIKARKPPFLSPQSLELALWKAFKLPEPLLEHRFTQDRRWRFDYAWPYWMVAVEIEGAIWTRGRHTRGTGFIKDMLKYNEAARLGWRVFRFSTEQFNNGYTMTYMQKVLK